MKKPLLSIVILCYNGERYISRLLDSILAQTYLDIEVIVVDDGSTDGSASLIKNYISRYAQKGYSLVYQYQANQGQASAINNALKYIRGKYLVWPDCDDFYAADNALEQMVTVWETCDESVGVVRCEVNLLDEKNMKVTGHFREVSGREGETDIFLDCLFCRGNYWAPAGNYMVKTSILMNVLQDGSIYTSRYGGQNWQLLLPLLYKHKCITIKKYLYNIVERSDSHSRSAFSSLQKSLDYITSLEDTLVNTLCRMDMDPEERNRFLEEVCWKYKSERLKYYFFFGKRKEGCILYRELSCKALYWLSWQHRLFYYMSWIPGGIYLVKAGKDIKKKVLKILK